MSSGDISVDFDGIDNAIAQLDAKFDEMINHVTTLSRDLREVGPAMDSPQTRPAFEEIMNEWTQRVPRLMETQRNTTTALRNMVQQHQQADRTQAEQARSQLGGSGGGGGGGVPAGAVAGGGAAAGGAAVAGAAARSSRTGGGGGGTGTGGSGSSRSAGSSGGSTGGGGGGTGRAGRQKRDPVYDTLSSNQANPYKNAANNPVQERAWGRRHEDGGRWAYDGVTYRGQSVTRSQGVQATVTRDMLRDVPRTESPPRALKSTDPGYDNRYKLELGHLWADRLGGPNGAHNFVPIHAYANGNRGMAHVEAMVADAVKRHGSVDIVVLPRYVGNEVIPREIFYHWRTPDGKWTGMKIDNIP